MDRRDATQDIREELQNIREDHQEYHHEGRCPDCVTDAKERFDSIQAELTKQSKFLVRIDGALLGCYEKPNGLIVRLDALEKWKLKADKVIDGFVAKMAWVGAGALGVLALAAWSIVKSTWGH